MTDVLKSLQENDESYANVVCCVGTNNCSSDSFDGDEIVKSFKDIVGATPLWLVGCQAKKHRQKKDFHACVCFIKFVCADDVIQACTFWVSEYARNLHETE